ncbi:cAMP phosphodiesterases class-II-domain-containing protein, partial [Lipomyces oligophaga]|uniref:cAMP phosphodiesterases class-II-domain-containing protein n=1 Tax=Lipomyces oligophaga TaxID=45792 RepID=UPI0034CF020E
GASGGPLEFGISGAIVKSYLEPWAKNVFVGIDAGTYMSGSSSLDPGYPLPSSSPSFSEHGSITPKTQLLGTGVMPFSSTLTNSAYVIRELVATVCITHAHLDHLSGFVINSSCFTADNPKVLAGLPSVIDAILKHVFNDIIWPNMTNEGDYPIGLITLRRLAELPTTTAPSKSSEELYVMPVDNSEEDNEGYEEIANGLEIRAYPISHGCVHKSGRPPKAFESSAFFVRDQRSGREILMFGDVEPDSISISPRNLPIWTAAARKFGSTKLAAIFIECSYASVQPETSLFGHLSSPFLIQELKMFAN